MNILKKVALVISFSPILTNSLSANSFSLGVKGGTLGLGAEATYRVNSYFSVVGSVNGFRLGGVSLNSKLVAFDGHVRLLTAGGSIGIHPLENGFKILAGLFYNGNQFEGTSTLKQDITLHGITYRRAQVRQDKIKIGFRQVSPYLGLGFEAPFYACSSWSFTGEVGVLFQGSAKAKNKKSQTSGNPSVVDDYIKKEAHKAATKPLIQYYPVIAIGVKYSF